MVQLVVKVANSEGSIPEWMLVEMQGQLECPGEEQLAGNFIGDLHFNKKGIPIIIIGHHILYGKVANLEKPYIVLIKNPASNSEDHNAPVAMDTDNINDEDADRIYYKVSASIKRKIVFKTRPKPIITYVPKKVL